jgi:large subunit ribosomal protein L10
LARDRRTGLDHSIKAFRNEDQTGFPRDPQGWRREVNRAQKAELVAELNKVFQDAESVVVTHYSGLSVAEVTDLRRKMSEAGASFKVAKNRLARLALEGTEYGSLSDMLTGPTAIAYSSDPVAAAKVAVDFAKGNEKLVIVGGAMGATALDADGVKALASMPSLDELRGKLVGLIQAPATKVAGVVQAPAGQLARVLGAYAQQGEAA